MSVRETEEPGAHARPARVVAGVDGSEASMAALRIAAASAARLGGRLVAVLATGGRPGSTAGRSDADGMTLLHRTTEQAFAAQPTQAVERLLRHGPAGDVLVEESRDADLLVVGSRGHGGLAGLLLGSVSIACAERARCPVLIVHAGDGRPHPMSARRPPLVVVGVGDSVHGAQRAARVRLHLGRRARREPGARRARGPRPGRRGAGPRRRGRGARDLTRPAPTARDRPARRCGRG